MSAFILSDRNFDSIAASMIGCIYSSNIYVRELAQKFSEAINSTELRAIAKPLKSEQEYAEQAIKEFVADLQKANVASVNYRYKADNLADGYVCRPEKGQKLTLPELLKVLDCAEYQSCEVPNWAETRMGRELNACINALAGHIARRSTEYDKAQWGLR